LAQNRKKNGRAKKQGNDAPRRKEGLPGWEMCTHHIGQGEKIADDTQKGPR